MVCQKCGAQIPNNSKFCVNCGNNVMGNNDTYYQKNNAQQGYYQQSYNEQAQAQKPLGMKWYKWMLYFAVPFGILSNVGVAMEFLTGRIYLDGVTGKDLDKMGITNDQFIQRVYDTFDGLKTVDMISGAVALLLAVIGIVLWSKLKNFKKDTDKTLTFLYGVNIVFNIVYVSLFYSITKIEEFPEIMGGTIAMSVIMMLVNLKYLKNRGHLFIK